METLKKINIADLLERTDSIKKGHFELSSGLHSNQYFQCAKLLQFPEYAEIAGAQLAELFNKEDVDLIVGPALGGIIIAHEVARALGKRMVFVERKNGVLCLRRGFEISKQEKILIIEDVITTAKSVNETAKIINSYDGEIVGYGCIVDRSQGQTGLNIKSLIQMTPEIYKPEDCPLCKQGSTSEKPGSRDILSL